MSDFEQLTEQERKDLLELSGRPVETKKALRIIDDLSARLNCLNSLLANKPPHEDVMVGAIRASVLPKRIKDLAKTK